MNKYIYIYSTQFIFPERGAKVELRRKKMVNGLEMTMGLQLVGQASNHQLLLPSLTLKALKIAAVD